VPAYPAYRFLDRIEISVLAAQPPETRLEEPLAFCRVFFLIDPGQDRDQLVGLPDKNAAFSALDRTDTGFIQRKPVRKSCVVHLDEPSPSLLHALKKCACFDFFFAGRFCELYCAGK
jgi:hypothetical protein